MTLKRGNIIPDEPLWRIVIFAICYFAVTAGITILGIDESFYYDSVFGIFISIVFATIITEIIRPGGDFRILGFSTDKYSLKMTAVGAVFGIAPFALIALLGRAGVFPTESGNISINGIFIYQIAFIFAGAVNEELFMRGIVFQSLERSIRPAILNPLSSLLFAMLHLGNQGYGAIAFANVFLANVLMNAIFLRSRSLLASTAFHFAWNTCQAVLIGSYISGSAYDISLLNVDLRPLGNLFFDPHFGFEGGLICTIVLILLIAGAYKLFEISPRVAAGIYKSEYRRPKEFNSEISR